MKYMVSVDIEGITGVAHWDEAMGKKEDYREYRAWMTKETLVVIKAILKVDKNADIYIRDAHGSARNIMLDDLPEQVKIIRGWDGGPYGMVQELDDTFDAILFVGYHSKAYDQGNPLAHTYKSSKVQAFKINGQSISEFYLNGLVAASHNVPVIFVSGDKALTEEVKGINDQIIRVATQEGRGDSVISYAPSKSHKMIAEGVKEAVKNMANIKDIKLESHYTLEIVYKEMKDAYKGKYYPGAVLEDAKTVKFESANLYEILRAKLFLV